jgi:rhomboid family protein
MFLPLTDHIRRQTFWFVTLVLILANVVIFLFELSLGPSLDRFVYVFGIVPARYTVPYFLRRTPLDGLLLPLFVSMFLHGGWLHLLGNMLFLFVFGRSVEDRYGHVRFLVMYLGCGLAAAITHILFTAGSRVPTIGASGCIAGVLGAYFVSFPRARITTLIWLIFFYWTIQVPAVIILGYWFFLQFITGFQMLTIQTATSGGVAWWAHIGGFLTGILAAWILPKRRQGTQVELIPW